VLTDTDRAAISDEVNAHYKMLQAMLPLAAADVRAATTAFAGTVLRRWGVEGLTEARRLLANGRAFGPP
jgi:hypothetical protein